MIKVNDVNKSNELNSSKTVRKSGDGPSFSAYLNQSTRPSDNGVGGVNNVNVANAIFATQMVGEEEEREIRKKLVKRGKTMLEKLEEIRDGLLLGYIDKERLIEISRLVKENTPESSDPQLQEIMAEIELRVEVELAKLTK